MAQGGKSGEFPSDFGDKRGASFPHNGAPVVNSGGKYPWLKIQREFHPASAAQWRGERKISELEAGDEIFRFGDFFGLAQPVFIVDNGLESL